MIRKPASHWNGHRGAERYVATRFACKRYVGLFQRLPIHCKLLAVRRRTVQKLIWVGTTGLAQPTLGNGAAATYAYWGPSAASVFLKLILLSWRITKQKPGRFNLQFHRRVWHIVKLDLAEWELVLQFHLFSVWVRWLLGLLWRSWSRRGRSQSLSADKNREQWQWGVFS